jgi:hypothetical protein
MTVCKIIFSSVVKGKIIPLQAVEALRVAPTFSDIQLTDGSKVVSPWCWLLFTPRKGPGTHFC